MEEAEERQGVKIKKTKALWAIIGVLVLAVVVLTVITWGQGFTQELVTTGNVVQEAGTPVADKQQNCRDVQVPYEATEPYYRTEYYEESVPYTDQECEQKTLVYKVDRGQCQQWEDNIFADDIPAKYSCTITNLDTEQGNFFMRIGFNVQGQPIGEDQQKTIYPQQSQTFTVQRNAQVDTCYCAESAPTKKVCHDVTRYKEVQRERQVKDYKTVINYRTELECD